MNDYKKQIIDLYRGRGWKSTFVKIRFFDAPLIKAEKLLPKKGKFVDLGCGEGIFTNYLGITSDERQILAFEIDKKRIQNANIGLQNVKFLHGDITKTTIPKCDNIIIFHVLHHLKSFKQQEELIKKCSESLSKNGKIFILEIKIGLSLGFFIGAITDYFLVPIFFENRFFSPIFFRTQKNWAEMLKRNNFKTEVVDLSKNEIISNILIKCDKQ